MHLNASTLAYRVPSALLPGMISALDPFQRPRATATQERWLRYAEQHGHSARVLDATGIEVAIPYVAYTDTASGRVCRDGVDWEQVRSWHELREVLGY